MSHYDEPEAGQLASLSDYVARCQKRVSRARAKQAIAERESADADTALSLAEGELARWLEQHPDPQASLFEVAA